MTLVKFLNLASCAFQLVGLALASRIDLKAAAMSKAEADLPDTMYLDVYRSAVDEKQRTPSDEETRFHALQLQNNDARNSSFIRWSITLIAIGTAIQGVTAWMSPD